MAVETTPGGYGIRKQDTPATVTQERDLANRQGGPAVGADVSVSVVTPQGIRETVTLPALDHKAMGRKTDPAFERSERSVKGRIRQLGTVPAVVVSFLPVELRSDSYLYPLKVAVIKPPKGKEPYATYVFAEYFIDYTKQHVDSPTTAFEWAPIQMAMDFSGTNPQGVFVFSAPNVGPGETRAQLHARIAEMLEDPEWKARVSYEPHHGGMTYGAALEAKRQSAIAWMFEQVSRGTTMDLGKRAYERPGLPQKASAHRLFALGLIQVLPAWVEQKHDLDVKPATCPQCARRCEPGAVSCTNPGCGGLKGPYVLDPRKAYEIGAITEEDESLERLSRGTLKEMGISDYVAESQEEKLARLKSGGIRPKSLSALRQLEYEDESKGRDADRSGKAVATAVAEALAKTPKKADKEKEA
jgi:hypothetical protein